MCPGSLGQIAAAKASISSRERGKPIHNGPLHPPPTKTEEEFPRTHLRLAADRTERREFSHTHPRPKVAVAAPIRIFFGNVLFIKWLKKHKSGKQMFIAQLLRMQKN